MKVSLWDDVSLDNDRIVVLDRVARHGSKFKVAGVGDRLLLSAEWAGHWRCKGMLCLRLAPAFEALVVKLVLAIEYLDMLVLLDVLKADAALLVLLRKVMRPARLPVRIAHCLLEQGTHNVFEGVEAQGRSIGVDRQLVDEFLFWFYLVFFFRFWHSCYK